MKDTFELHSKMTILRSVVILTLNDCTVQRVLNIRHFEIRRFSLRLLLNCYPNFDIFDIRSIPAGTNRDGHRRMTVLNVFRIQREQHFCFLGDHQSRRRAPQQVPDPPDGQAHGQLGSRYPQRSQLSRCRNLQGTTLIDITKGSSIIDVREF